MIPIKKSRPQGQAFVPLFKLIYPNIRKNLAMFDFVGIQREKEEIDFHYFAENDN